MATDWTAISLAALGVAGTIGGGFLGAWMQQRSQQWQEHQRQRELASEVLGIVVQLHAEIHSKLSPGRFIATKQASTDQELRQLQEDRELPQEDRELRQQNRDLERLQEEGKALSAGSRAAVEQLVALAARHPSDEVRDLAIQLTEALPAALSSALEGATSQIVDAPTSAEDRARAEADHAKLRHLTVSLLYAVRHN